jgi:hypothetical protein
MSAPKRSITQVEGKGFDKVGDSYRGVFVSKKTVQIADRDGTREASLYKLAPPNGEAFGVWGSSQLDDLMSEVKPGEDVEITLTSIDEPKKKGFSGMKRYRVDIY